MCKAYFPEVEEHLKTINETAHSELLSNMHNIKHTFLVKRKKILTIRYTSINISACTHLYYK